MSDRPSSSVQNDDLDPQSGGWHTPKTQSAWRSPVQATPVVAEWKRVVALPTELEEIPEEAGQWHLPRPEDTLFSATDEIEVQEILPPEDVSVESPSDAMLSPEDMILSLIQQTPATPASDDDEVDLELDDEDFQDTDTRLLELLDEEDDENFSMSELVALASLMDEAQTSDSSDPSAMATELEAGLSPAERAMVHSGEEDDDEFSGESAADIARRMAEQFSQTGASQPMDVSSSQSARTTPGAEGESAADIARRMAQQYAGDGGDVAPTSQEGESAADIARRMAQQYAGDGGDFTPIPEQTAPYDPAAIELAQKFIESQQQVQILKQQYAAGQLSREDLQAQLRQHMVLDNNNIWWMMGVETDTWYKYENNQWIQAVPPVQLPSSRSPLTETGSLDPNQVIAGSLPYLPEDSREQTQYTQTDYSSERSVAVDENFMPLPKRVPLQDPNATMVGSAAYEDTQPNDELTIQNMRRVSSEATVPSMPLASDQATVPIQSRVTATSIESPIQQADVVPDYDISGQSAETIGQYEQKERASNMRMLVIALSILVGVGLLSLIVAGVGIIVWYNNTISPFENSIAALANYEPPFQTARILDANGDLIAELNSRDGGARTEISLDQMSPYLLHAVISQEDQTYYENPGYSLPSIVRAFLQNLSSGEIESGASTITQQIARNLVLQDTQPTADRKIKEILIAMEIARRYDKNFILELYLNEFFFGNRSYGAEAAAEFYFDKSASELNIAESALLASIIPAPAENDPVINKQNAMINMKEVLRRMVDVGCLDFQHGQWASGQDFCITEDTIVQFEGSPVSLISINNDGSFGDLAALQIAEVEIAQFIPADARQKYPHFVNWVQAQIEATYGPDAMFQRGFTIHTTLIPRIQDVAEQALAQQVALLVNNGVNTGAVMVTDPRNGSVRAMVGSPDFSNEDIDGQVDNTRTWQQPGSSIKGIVYSAALEGRADGQYLTPVSILWDVPSFYQNVNYNPVNFDRQYRGPVTVRDAIQQSLNVPAVKAFEFIGVNEYLETAHAMGLQFLDDATFGLPSALGANDVRLIDMMKAYGTLANNGMYTPLHAIERITEDVNGQEVDVLLTPGEQPHQAISPQLAYLMQNILSDDNARRPQFPTNSNLTLTRLGIPTQNVVAAKTGTSNDGRDLWTMGFTTNTVVGVWLGTYDNSPTFNVTGFQAAAPVWNVVMEAAINGRPPEQFANPGGVVVREVCKDTGTLVGANCINRINELFIDTKPPPPSEQGFVQQIAIDTWTGLRANQWCQENNVVQVFADINDSFATTWINSTAGGRQFAQLVGLPVPLQPAPPSTSECQQGQVLPTVNLNNPTSNQTVAETLTITGQVVAPDFNRYELQIASIANPEAFQSITSSQQQQANAGSPLGTWDTRSVPNGTYILRLAAFSNSGGVIRRDVQINVSNVPPTPTPSPIPTFLPTQPPIIISTPLPFDNPTPTATLALN